jgi:hypothetical protein
MQIRHYRIKLAIRRIVQKKVNLVHIYSLSRRNLRSPVLKQKGSD